jgi:Glycine-rich domain-containing protein-like
LAFHKLWQLVTGTSWPEEGILRAEVEEAVTMTILPGAPEKGGIRANFWKGYDGLAEIMDSVICHAPSIVADPKNGSNPSLQEIWHDYARYLIASTYAPNFNLAPGCTIDLVWHTHQTEPRSYHQTMNALPRFINHNPCGKLNPPCIEWAHRTTKVWEDLYGRGVDLPGHSIGCCCSDGPPLSAVRPRYEWEQAPSTPAQRFVWWFEKEHYTTHDSVGCFQLLLPPYGLKLGLEGFPHDVEAAVLLCCYIGLDVARAPKLHTALSNLHSSLTVVDTATGKRTVLRILALVLDGLLACINGCLFNCLFQMIRWVCLCGDTVDPLQRQYENVIKSHQDSFRPLGVHLALHFCVVGPSNLNGTQWRGPGIFFERLPG